MLYYVTAAYVGARRALARDQGKADDCPDSFGRLVVAEIPVLSRRVGRWRVTTWSIFFFGLVLVSEIALSEVTPGPVLSPRWRLGIAFAATVVFLGGWAVTHAIRSAGWRPGPRVGRHKVDQRD